MNEYIRNRVTNPAIKSANQSNNNSAGSSYNNSHSQQLACIQSSQWTWKRFAQRVSGYLYRIGCDEDWQNRKDKEWQRMTNLTFQDWQGKNQKVHLISPWIFFIKTKWPLCTKIKFVSVTLGMEVAHFGREIELLVVNCACWDHRSH